MTESSEVKGHAARAGADLEDRIAVLAGERAPKRQVLAVPAAFEVVPDHLGRGHPSRSSGTPAYFSRNASSAARVPAQVTRRTRPAKIS